MSGREWQTRKKRIDALLSACGWQVVPYQIEATKVIEKAIAQGKRKIFIAMATGTGKTYTREDLEDIRDFDPRVLPEGYLIRPNASHTFVYVSTIQRMCANLFGAERVFESRKDETEDDAEAQKLDIPIHAFDAVIADECHRGYTAQEESLWREALDHFDGVTIGLTATPAAHTVAYFGEPVFRYGYEEAVRDGYLVDYDPVAIYSGVRLNGIFLSEGERVGQIDPETGLERLDHLEDERVFDASQVERDITSPDSNRKILEEVKKYALAHEEQYGRFPKTLIFAVNDLPHVSHADQVVRLCREVFQRGDDFVQKITGSPTVDRPLQRIREFRNRPRPGIAVTVDMLSTGVDIPALEFIVFLRPVKSRILFEQMVGRGTRRCDEINKSHFTLFDCFGGTLLEYFKSVSAFTVDPPLKPTRSLQEIIEDIYQNLDRAYHVRVFVKRLHRVAKEMAGGAMEKFACFIPDGDLKRFAAALPRLLEEEFAGTMKVLRDPEFQELLINYPRAKKSFWVAYDTRDVVESRELIGPYSPEEYLHSFTRFVEENRDKIDAIRILFERPSDWSTDALHELRKALQENNLSENNLRKAYHNELADIISMIKHAASGEPLLTAQQRVDRALGRLAQDQTFTEEQRRWLGLIRDHLIENLTVDRDDFDRIPAFTRLGGWKAADRAFAHRLGSLLRTINTQVAAA